MLEYINQLRVKGNSIEESAIEGAVLRLRPIMMTMLVATFGLLARRTVARYWFRLQRPFAIVIVGGLISDLGDEHLSLCRAVCLRVSREGDKPPETEQALKRTPSSAP